MIIHENQDVFRVGKPLLRANSAMILVHGRGASCQSIMTLAEQFPREDMAYLAPQAARNTWYPHSFLSPIEANEPYLTSALVVLSRLVQEIEDEGMIPAEKIIIGGFSQGACLASEFIYRNPRRYGGLLVFSGGVIGPLDSPIPAQGDLSETPVFLGCSDVDAHIPLVRVEETAKVFEDMGAFVTKRIYPQMGHTIIQDEILIAQDIVNSL